MRGFHLDAFRPMRAIHPFRVRLGLLHHEYQSTKSPAASRSTASSGSLALQIVAAKLQSYPPWAWSVALAQMFTSSCRGSQLHMQKNHRRAAKVRLLAKGMNPTDLAVAAEA